jgi:hypothetical protein
MSIDVVSRDRAERESTSGAIPCEITAVDLSGEPTVTVRPLTAVPYDTFDGETLSPTPLEIEKVPYVFPSSDDFAFFVPPKIGMQGHLTVTQTEVGEAEGGVATSSRRRDARSGYFTPSGNLGGAAFAGNAEWAELRSKDGRVALNANTVHLEAGQTSLIITPAGFDIVVAGVSLLAAMKQMSAHIATLEALVHPGGLAHTGTQARMIDNFTQAAPPQRDERGARA